MEDMTNACDIPVWGTVGEMVGGVEVAVVGAPVLWYDWSSCSSCPRSSEFCCPASVEAGVLGDMPGAKSMADDVDVAEIEACVEERRPLLAGRGPLLLGVFRHGVLISETSTRNTNFGSLLDCTR